MNREISQRELRNNSGAVLREVEQGGSFTVTRNGAAVAELVPLRRRRFVAAQAAIELFQEAPEIDHKRFRDDLDRVIDQDPMPHG